MPHRFAQIAFTDAVRDVQREMGTRSGYSDFDQGTDRNHQLASREVSFIQARDSFYMATVGQQGWPYVQHRGGPVGFVRVLDEQTLGYADFGGNGQYVSTGNLRKDDRVCLIFVDYPNRRRIKIFGRAEEVDSSNHGLLEQLEVDDYRGSVERGFLIKVEAFDWNCPQHIAPRFTEAEVLGLVDPLKTRNRLLERLFAQPRPAPAQDRWGEGPLSLVVAGMRQLTPRVRAFELRAEGSELLPRVRPGAHLRVPVVLSSGKVVERHYSLCSAPESRQTYEIAVLRKDNGEGGSRAMFERVCLGTVLRCGLPENYFGLHSGVQPALFIAGGIGVTPLLPMAQALDAREVRYAFHYAGRSEREMPYLAQLRAVAGGRLSEYSGERGERMDVFDVLRAQPADVRVYVCGPPAMIDAVRAAASAHGLAPQQVRFERFSAAFAPDAAAPCDVRLARSQRTVKVAPGANLLDALLWADVPVPHSCRTGQCGSCTTLALEGEVEHRDEVLTREQRDAGWFCPCVSAPSGSRLVIDR